MRRIDFPEPIEYRPHGAAASKTVSFPEWLCEAIVLALRKGRDGVLLADRLCKLVTESVGAALVEDADYDAIGKCLDSVEWDPGLSKHLAPWVRAWNAAPRVDLARLTKAIAQPKPCGKFDDHRIPTSSGPGYFPQGELSAEADPR